MLFQSANNLGNINFGTRNTVNMTLDTIGRLGLGTQAPRFLADFRGSDDYWSGGELQLSTPNETNFLRFFGGRQGDPHPFIAFHELDTFHLVTTAADFSTYKHRLTMLPNGFVGLGTSTPSAELDIMSGDPDDGVEVHLSNLDTSHFLRLYSGRENLPTPIMYWNHGDALEIGMADPDEGNYQRFLSFDGKTIGVHNNGNSVFIGEGAGSNDNLLLGDHWSVGIGNRALEANILGLANTAVGYSALGSNLDGNYNVAIGSSALWQNRSSYNTAVGTAALNDHVSGGYNLAMGYAAGARLISGSRNVFIGNAAGFKDTLGYYNTVVGDEAMFYNEHGSNNTIIGSGAGLGVEDQDYSGNVLLGFNAGYYINSDNKLS
jgi:hypothetical protein